jgi:rhodanese-related sulfurtransferase
MNFKFRLNRRTVLGLCTAMSIFAFVTIMGQISLSSDELTDEGKRQKIGQMYAEYKKDFPEVLDISPQDALKLAETQQVVFIDVRKVEEQKVSMLPGAITQVEFQNNLEKYKDYVKIAYCTISYRSGKFARKLQESGVIVNNLEGGILAWVHAGGKVFDHKGESHRIHVYGRVWNLSPERFEAVW